MEPEEYTRMYQLEDRYWWFVGRRRLVQALMASVPACRVPPDSRLLDVGCGTGAMSRELQPLGQVVSLDFCESALKMARTRGLTGLCQGSAEALPFRSNTFQAITALDVVEHVKDDRGALREMYRVAAPGGVAIITVPAYRCLWSEHDVALHHYRRYTAPGIRRVVSEAGFRVLKLSYAMTLLLPAVAVTRWLQRLRPKAAREARATLPKLGDRANSLLLRLLEFEAGLVSRWYLPAGVSIVCIGQKEVG